MIKFNDLPNASRVWDEFREPSILDRFTTEQLIAIRWIVLKHYMIFYIEWITNLALDKKSFSYRVFGVDMHFIELVDYSGNKVKPMSFDEFFAIVVVANTDNF